jgi:hypothetical protein
VSPRLGAGLWFVFAIHLLLIVGFLIYCVECSFRLGLGFAVDVARAALCVVVGVLNRC